MKSLRVLLAVFVVSLFSISSGAIASSMFSIEDLSYEGAVRFKDGVYGESRLGFANGTFAVDSKNNLIYIVGHQNDQAVGVYGLAEFSKAESIAELPMSRNVQPFIDILDRAASGNPHDLDRITGMAFIEDNLVLNAARYYDAGGSITDTTLVIEGYQDLKNSEVSGFYSLEGRVHAAGWMTPISGPLRLKTSADYIFGFASNLPINLRNSMGPSAFAVNTDDLFNIQPGQIITSTALLDFSVENQLRDDHYNESGTNDVWTEVSKAFVGLIIPGTNTYAVFGFSAGHEYGVGYKIVQDTGNTCGGACPKVASDRYNYYWLWDVDDFIDVLDGNKEPHELEPYEYGRLNLPFEINADGSAPNVMMAANYDPDNQKLYFLIGDADRLQSRFESLPILLRYSINFGSRPGAPSNVSVE